MRRYYDCGVPVEFRVEIAVRPKMSQDFNRNTSLSEPDVSVKPLIPVMIETWECVKNVKLATHLYLSSLHTE